MPRKGEVKRRDVLPDPKYHDRMVTKFINSMMHDGKKSLTERIFYQALDVVADRSKEDALGVITWVVWLRTSSGPAGDLAPRSSPACRG